MNFQIERKTDGKRLKKSWKGFAIGNIVWIITVDWKDFLFSTKIKLNGNARWGVGSAPETANTWSWS